MKRGDSLDVDFWRVFILDCVCLEYCGVVTLVSFEIMIMIFRMVSFRSYAVPIAMGYCRYLHN